MKDKIAKVIIVIVIAFFSLSLIRIGMFHKYRIMDIKIINNKITYREKVKRSNNELMYKGISKSVQDSRVVEVSNLGLIWRGKEVVFEDSVYIKNLRYYFPMGEILEKLGVKVNKSNNIVYLMFDNKNYIIDITEQNIIKEDKRYSMRGEILKINNIDYIGLNDIVFLFNLRDKYDKNTNDIFLCIKEKYNNEDIESNINGKAVIIRFEDITAGEELILDDNILKMKVLGDYLKSKGVRYNVAWIPRYVNPSLGIDNNLLNNNSMSNVEFISLLDSWIYNGARIGLHGYTHQYGDEASVKGVELSWRYNNDVQSTIRVIEDSINCANTLNIPIDFFESPHYRATRMQQRILEGYFNILFEPIRGYWNINPIISANNHETLYVPAPFRMKFDSTVEDAIGILKRNSNRNWILMSFFYHPSREYSNIFIREIGDDGYIGYDIDDNSLMKNIVDGLKQYNYRTITVDELIRKE